MAKNPASSLTVVASKKVLQLLIGLLFLAMGIIGFSSGRGPGSQIAKELNSMIGGKDNEILLYILSALELVCGLFLAAQMVVKAIPEKLAKLAKVVILIFWLVLIVILDILTVNFGSFKGVDWFVWIEQVMLHLIVLSAMAQIQN